METSNEQPIKDIVDGVVAGAEEKAIENGATKSDREWFRGVVEKAQNSATKNDARDILQEARENDPTTDRFPFAA